jgi:hypothetical protein
MISATDAQNHLLKRTPKQKNARSRCRDKNFTTRYLEGPVANLKGVPVECASAKFH